MSQWPSDVDETDDGYESRCEQIRRIRVSLLALWEGLNVSPCRVLDPFAGTATAVRVANRLGRKGIGLDLNPKYLDLADVRTSHVQMEF